MTAAVTACELAVVIGRLHAVIDQEHRKPVD